MDPYMRSGYQPQNGAQDELAAQSQNSGMLHQDSYISQGVNLSHSNSIDQMGYPNAHIVAGEINIRVFSNNSGYTFEESSLITDANSTISGPSYLSSLNNNNIGSPVSNTAISGFSGMVDQEYQQTGTTFCKRQGETCPNPMAMPRSVTPIYQGSSSSAPPMMSFKKPRVETRPEFHPMRVRGYDGESSSSFFVQQNVVPNQQNVVPNQQNVMNMNSLMNPPTPQQRVHVQSLQLPPPRTPSQQVGVEPQNHGPRGGIYIQRLMGYVHQQRHRPPDNDIRYWKKFVEEYYSPGAKKRWCLSSYDGGSRHAHGAFSLAATDSWRCDFCKSQTSKGFVATYEVLPRLKKTYFDNGLTEQLMYLDSPYEIRIPSGYVILIFGKAVQQSVYKEFRIVHEGLLRVVFTQDLKISAWEFCIRRHEEVIPRSWLATEVNELLENATKLRNRIEGNGNTDDSPGEDLQTNFNRLAAAGQELKGKLELPHIDEVGFSIDVVRCLQMSEVLDSMKDLISYSQSRNLSPIESLRRYPAEVMNTKLKMKEMMEMMQFQRTPTAPPTNTPFMLRTFNNPRDQASSSRMYAMPPPSQPQPQPHHQIPRIPPSSSPSPSPSSVMVPYRASSSSNPQQDHVLNDLLRMMREEGAKGASVNPSMRGNSRLVYDPNAENPRIMFTQTHEDEDQDEEEAKNKGKGLLNSSSSSNSNRDVLHAGGVGVMEVKRELDLEEDFTSPPPYEGKGKGIM